MNPSQLIQLTKNMNNQPVIPNAGNTPGLTHEKLCALGHAIVNDMSPNPMLDCIMEGQTTAEILEEVDKLDNLYEKTLEEAGKIVARNVLSGHIVPSPHELADCLIFTDPKYTTEELEQCIRDCLGEINVLQSEILRRQTGKPVDPDLIALIFLKQYLKK